MVFVYSQGLGVLQHHGAADSALHPVDPVESWRILSLPICFTCEPRRFSSRQQPESRRPDTMHQPRKPQLQSLTAGERGVASACRKTF